MSDQPPLPVIGQEAWGDDLNAYLSALDARIVLLEALSASYARFNFNAQTVAPPASGQVRVNNATPALATTVWVHNVDSEGTDVSLMLGQVLSGWRIYLQDRDDSSKWVRYNVSGAPVDQGTYMEYPVTVFDSLGTVPYQNVVVGVRPL
jgi:hypothetical protein